MGAPGGLQEVTYTIPADKCGLVIGKGKETATACINLRKKVMIPGLCIIV